MKILRTASLGSNFTGSYKKKSVVVIHGPSCYKMVQRKDEDNNKKLSLDGYLENKRNCKYEFSIHASDFLVYLDNL